jgi:tetratricopeptide (TPR) repeat protein
MRSGRKLPARPYSCGIIHDRNTRVPKSGRCESTPLFSWKQLLPCLFVVAAWVAPLRAQKTRYTPNFGAAGKPPLSIVHDSTFDNNPPTEEESCFPWKVSALRATSVSVRRLEVSAKARTEYDKACDASNKNRFDEAEHHARSAIDQFKAYPAAWVMLGVIFEEQRKSPEARDACSHASAIDATYLPAYFCSAEVSVRRREWEQVLSSADEALRIQSEGNPYGHYYRATAYLHMNNLAEAKKSALQAAALDGNHDEPLVNFLLAKIYEREGDSVNAIAQLQEFLRHPTGRQQQDVARQLLAKLESQPSTK